MFYMSDVKHRISIGHAAMMSATTPISRYLVPAEGRSSLKLLYNNR